jgi:hypothetical protein
MSRPFWLDEGGDPGFGSLGLRETWYISSEYLPLTAPFYALFDPARSDHMDSPYSEEGSYRLDLGVPHGYAWLSIHEGMRPLTRYYNPTISDHLTWLYSDSEEGPDPDVWPDGYAVNATYWGYANPDLGRWGYERFGNLLSKPEVVQYALDHGTTLENSKLRVLFNPI